MFDPLTIGAANYWSNFKRLFISFYIDSNRDFGERKYLP